PPQEAHVLPRTGLVDLPGDDVGLRAVAHQVRRDLKGLRRGVAEAERPGIGHDRGVEQRRHVGVQLGAGLPDQPVDDGPGRGGVGDDEVDMAGARVGHVVVDVDHPLHPIGPRRGAPRPRHLAVYHHQGVPRLLAPGRRLARRGDPLNAREEPPLGQDPVVRERLGPLPQPLQQPVQGQERADAVGIGVDMTGDEKPVAGREGFDDTPVRVHSAPVSFVSAEPTSRRSSKMRAPRAMDSSGLMWISGVWRRRIRWPISVRIYPVARVNASMVRALASSSPSTLTKIFTWRRSPDTSTSATVTNPTRGSLSLRMMSLASRLISSRILWIRWPAMTSNLPSTPPPTAGSAPL